MGCDRKAPSYRQQHHSQCINQPRKIVMLFKKQLQFCFWGKSCEHPKNILKIQVLKYRKVSIYSPYLNYSPSSNQGPWHGQKRPCSMIFWAKISYKMIAINHENKNWQHLLFLFLRFIHFFDRIICNLATKNVQVFIRARAINRDFMVCSFCLYYKP